MKHFFERWTVLSAPKQAALIVIASFLGLTLYTSVATVILQPIVHYFSSSYDSN